MPATGQGRAGREGVGERAERADGLVEGLSGDEVVHGAVQPVFRGDDAAVQGPSLRGEAEREVTPVDLVDAAFHQSLGDEAIDETARAVARFADEQPAESIECERTVVPEDAQNLCLGRRYAQRAQLGSE